MKKITLFLVTIYLTSGAQVPNLLKDINPGSAASKFGEFSLLPNNDMLFSVITASSSSAGIWVSDGSSPGTKMLKPYPGYNFTNFSGTQYFGVKNVPGYSLWRTNGTVMGTDSLLTPGIKSATNLNVVNNALVFVGTNNANAFELWRSDGTTAGTYSLTTPASSIKTFTVYNNLLYFSLTNTVTGTELWRTDGTLSGTFMLKDIWMGAGSSFNTNPIKAYFSNTLFLQANDGINGMELWKTDGTTAGTALLKDIVPGSGNSSMYEFFNANNGIYFNANNLVNGIELWFSDGTPANTQMIIDLNPGSGSSSITKMTFLGNDAYYFTNSIGNNNQPTLFKTNGTAATTTSLNVMTGLPTYTFLTSSLIHAWNPLLYNNNLYFVLERRELSSMPAPYFDSLYFYKVDLNLTTKSLITRFTNQNTPSSQSQTGAFENFIIGSKLIYTFKQTYDNTISLAILNLANGQHKMYHHLGSSTNGGQNYYRQFGNKIYYTNKVGDCEPGYIDLTNDSIYTLKDIRSGGSAFNCSGAVINYWDYKIHKLNNKGYFIAYEPSYGVEFFETDFTPTGTFRVKDIYPGSLSFDNGNTAGTSSCYSDYIVYETPNNIFFCANDGVSGFELWSFINAPNNPGGGVSVQGLTSALEQPDFYPNPTTGKVHVNSQEDKIKHLKVLNALGSLVKEVHPSENTTSIEMDLSPFPSGIYFVTISTTKGELTKKLVKQ